MLNVLFQVYKNGIENIFSKMVSIFKLSIYPAPYLLIEYIINDNIIIVIQPVAKSASEPNDGVCEDGEGWGCIAEIASKISIILIKIIVIMIIILILIIILMMMMIIIIIKQTLYDVFAATVMDCIAEIGLDPNGVQKCVEVFIFLELTMIRMMTMMMIIIAGVQKCVEVSKYQRAIF